MVLRHLLIVSQLQLLNSPLPDAPANGSASGVAASSAAPLQQNKDSDGGVSLGVDGSAGDGGHARGDAGVRPVGEGSARTATVEQSEPPEEREWVGTSSDAFEIAVSVLKVT